MCSTCHVRTAPAIRAASRRDVNGELDDASLVAVIASGRLPTGWRSYLIMMSTGNGSAAATGRHLLQLRQVHVVGASRASVSASA